MKRFLGACTIRFNARHRLRGHLFAGRYKSLIVDDCDPHYLRVVCDYLHLNPARAGLLKPETPLSADAWSSYPEYLQKPRARPKWLRPDRVFGEHGIRQDNQRGRLEFDRRMEAGRRQPGEEAGYAAIRGGWHDGAEEFVTLISISGLHGSQRG